ncbi:Bro-N domain-containing protein [Ancylobacter sp.]|uniref:BRO-N domain-containing protein n=1 Tax=Ancylobacter sp. TaxID=1872567 RepID=UPI003BA9161A
MTDPITRNGNATTTYRIRAVPLEGNPWFALADIRLVLGRQRGGDETAALGGDEQRVVRELSGAPLKGHGLKLVSESGLYKLIMSSKKPEARALQEWVTREVLPTIRKTGGYVLQGADRATVGEGTVAEMPDVGGELMPPVEGAGAIPEGAPPSPSKAPRPSPSTTRRRGT